MADQDDGATGVGVTLGLAMDLGDQRAGGIDKEQVATGCLGRHRFRDAVGGEDHRPVVRHLVELVDEDRALGLEALDHEAVVDDLVPDIDRPAIAREGALDDLDRAIDARAEAARTGKQDRERLLGVGHEQRLCCGPARSLAGLADHCLESNGNATGKQHERAGRRGQGAHQNGAGGRQGLLVVCLRNEPETAFLRR